MAVAANATPEQAPYADAYSDAAIQSLMDSLDEKEDHLQSIPMPKEDYNAIHEPVTKLKDNIQEFSEQENIYGPEPETWEHYAARQAAVEASMDAVYKAYHDDVPEGIKKSYLDEAVHTTREANEFWRKEFAKLLEKDQRMEQEMNAMRSQMAELQRTAKQQGFTEEQLAQSMVLAMTLLENSKAAREAAHKEKHPATARLFQDARQAVHECYQGIVGIPHKAKTAILNKAFHLADTAIQSIAGVFDKGISFLAKRKQAIAQMSPLYEQKMEAVPQQEPPKREEVAAQKTEAEEEQQNEPEKQQPEPEKDGPQEAAEMEKTDAAEKEPSEESEKKEQKAGSSPEVQKILQEADEAMKNLDYDKFYENHQKFQALAYNYNHNTKGMRDKLPDAERKFLSSLVNWEGKIFVLTAPSAPNYSKHDVLQKAEMELKHVAKECLMNNMLQADVVDYINKYAPSAGIAKEGSPYSKVNLGEKIVQEAMKDPQVQKATQQTNNAERQR